VSTPHPLALRHALSGGDPAQAAGSGHTDGFCQPEVPERLLLGADGSGSGLYLLFETSGLGPAHTREYLAVLTEPGALTAALNWYRAMEGSVLDGLPSVKAPTLYVWSTGDAALGRSAAEPPAPSCPAPSVSWSWTGSAIGSPKRHPRTWPGCCSTISGRPQGRPPGAPDQLCENDRVTNSTFALTDEQRQFRDTMRQFAEERIAPQAAEVDREAVFPWKSFAACVEMELPALGIPEAYGGAGADMVTQAIVTEELSRVCASTSLTILISKLGMLPVMNWGSEELKQKYLPRVAKGEIQASYCLSEADAGSDVASMRARAVRDGDDYVLTGSKYWITNAGISDVYIVFAKTDPNAGGRGISCFLVERDWGITIAKHEDKLGMRGSPTGEVVLDEVRVPASHRIGEEGQGFTIAMHTLDRSRPTIGAQAVGIAQGAIDYSAAYMKQRHAFGAPIADLQGLRFILADMAMRNEAARALVYRACSMVDDDPGGELTLFGAMAKAFASDTSMSVTIDAVQLLGGYGYTKDFPVERFLRDAKVTQIYEGTNQVQRVVIARELLKNV
jgi:alkylation response protein AidB-like acyl-CoA dehydrogenase